MKSQLKDYKLLQDNKLLQDTSLLSYLISNLHLILKLINNLIPKTPLIKLPRKRIINQNIKN